VGSLIADSRQYRVYRIQRKGRDAIVEMLYDTRRFGPVVIPFAMQKPVDTWKVDADRTWGLAQAPGRAG
jgi:hypothetical protein